MKNTTWIGVLLIAGFLYSCQSKSAEARDEVITVSEAPEVTGSVDDIANTWCDLMRQEFRAKNTDDSDLIAAAEKVVKDYQTKIEKKYESDPAVVQDIIAKMMSCDAALEGRK